ncbi:unnamed protein product, partial [Polarella glacialis]
SSKVTIEVRALGEGGTNVINFNAKPEAAFEKMMKAWSNYHGIPVDQVRFVYGGTVELRAEQSPQELGWLPADQGAGPYIVVAQPVAPVPAVAAVEDVPTSAPLPSEGPLPTAPFPAEVLKAAQDAPFPAEALKASQDAPSSSEKSLLEPTTTLLQEPTMPTCDGSVEVKVVADGESGMNELQFKMKLSTPFRKMMQRWCSHHG